MPRRETVPFRMKFRQSLLFRYLVVMVLYFLLAPWVFFGLIQLWEQFGERAAEGRQDEKPYEATALEEQWHRLAADLAGRSAEDIIESVSRMHAAIPEAVMFWVSADGQLQAVFPQDHAMDETWDAAETVRFMKQSYGGDPFTVVALLEEGENGFIVLQIPRSLLYVSLPPFAYLLFNLLALSILLLLFVFISWLFFFWIRRRLMRLQRAMQEADEQGIPRTVKVRRTDEIGQLEQSFNAMVHQLREGVRRQAEEERLRRDLVASLSHDLRTPLTALRAQVYRLREEALSEEGRRTLALIDQKVDHLGDMVENLFSLNLLSAGKMPYRPVRTDVVRLVRETVAFWYPSFEAEGFDVDVALPDEPVFWEVDEQWFRRIWDNLLKNVLHHAKDGRGVAVAFERGPFGERFVLRDRGPGFGRSPQKGTGLGLAIVELMCRGMGLEFSLASDEDGTCCVLQRRSQENRVDGRQRRELSLAKD